MRRRTLEKCRQIGVVVTTVSMLASSAWGQAPASAPKPATPKAPAAAAPAATGKATLTAPANPKKLLASAATKRAAGDFAGALADYQASDAADPSPATIEGIAFCHDKLGHFDDALTWYDAFLANAPPALQLEANAAHARVDAIRAMPGQLHLESNPPNAVVVLDGKEQPRHTPLDVDLPAGKHTIHLVAAGHDPLDRDIDVVSRFKANLVLEPPLTPPPPPPPPAPVVVAPPPPPPPRSVVPAYIVGGLALVGAGVGIGFGIAALNDKSSFNKNPTTSTANSGENEALVSDMGFGVALTLGITSIILYTTRNEPTSPLPIAQPATTPNAPPPATPADKPGKATSSNDITLTAAPFMTPHGGGAGALIRF